MQVDPVVSGLILLTALLLLCVNHLVILPYLVKPEEFFVKRLRPRGHHKFTHAHLLARAFGSGFISAGLHSLAFCLALSLVLDFDWTWVWLVLTLGGGLLVGVGNCIYFRCWRYRRLAPSVRKGKLDGAKDLFERRSH